MIPTLFRTCCKNTFFAPGKNSNANPKSHHPDQTDATVPGQEEQKNSQNNAPFGCRDHMSDNGCIPKRTDVPTAVKKDNGLKKNGLCSVSDAWLEMLLKRLGPCLPSSTSPNLVRRLVIPAEGTNEGTRVRLRLVLWSAAVWIPNCFESFYTKNLLSGKAPLCVENAGRHPDASSPLVLATWRWRKGAFMCSHATSLFQINRTAVFLFQDFCFWGWGLSKIHWQEFVRGRISITVQESGLGTCIASADFPSDVLSFSVYTLSFCFISSYYHLWLFLPCVSLQFPSLLFTFLSFRCTFVSFQFVFLPGSWAMGSDQPLGVQSPSFLGKKWVFHSMTWNYKHKTYKNNCYYHYYCHYYYFYFYYYHFYDDHNYNNHYKNCEWNTTATVLQLHHTIRTNP